MGTKVNTIALLIGVAMTATACGGGGSGGGKVTVATATVDTAVVVTEPTNGGILAESPTDTPEFDNLELQDLVRDFNKGVPTGVDGDLLQDVINAHAAGYNGTGFDVYTTDAGVSITQAIAPGANSMDFRTESSLALFDEVDPNDSFVGGVVTGDGDMTTNDYIRFDGDAGRYEAGAAALVWDKFDNVNGSVIEGQINRTRNADNELDLSAALAPAEGSLR